MLCTYMLHLLAYRNVRAGINSQRYPLWPFGVNARKSYGVRTTRKYIEYGILSHLLKLYMGIYK